MNLAGFIHIHFAVQVYTIIHQYDIRLSIRHSCIGFVQYNLGLSFGAIGNGFDTGQILIQIDFIIGMSIFRYCRGNGGIDPIRDSCLGCCCLFLQLAYIDCIHIIFAVCNIMNLLSANTDSVFAEFQTSSTIANGQSLGINNRIFKCSTM